MSFDVLLLIHVVMGLVTSIIMLLTGSQKGGGKSV